MFHYSTSTDHIDLLHQVRQLVTSRNLTAVAVNAAGTGYVVDDILTVAGGTSTHAAQLRVKTVGGSGEITAIVVEKAGAYSVDPTTSANAATGGTGSSATFNLTMSAAEWSVLGRSLKAASATVSNGGSGYLIGDTVWLVSGTRHKNVTGVDQDIPTFTVTGVSAGAITSVSVDNAGHLQNAPAGSTLVSGGTGSGAELTVTWTEVTDTDQVAILQGTAAGSTTAPIAILHAYQDLDRLSTNPVYNWSLASCTSYDPGSQVHEQPNYLGSLNVSTGVIADTAPILPLKDADTYDMDFWVQWTGRHIQLVVKTQSGSTTRYPSMLMGLLNPFQSGADQPYPMVVQGANEYHYSRWDDLNPAQGGIGDPMGPDGAWVWTGTEWLRYYNRSANGTTVSDNNSYNVGIWPGVYGDIDNDTKNEASNTGFSRTDLMLSSSSYKLMRTPDTGGDIFPLFRRYVLASDSSSLGRVLYGELPGHFWFHTAEEAISSEDVLKQNGSRYLVFQSGDRVERYTFFAMEVE